MMNLFHKLIEKIKIMKVNLEINARAAAIKIKGRRNGNLQSSGHAKNWQPK